MGKMAKKIYVGLIFVLIVFFLQGTVVHACPLCGAAVDESADERFNKPLADLRTVYEQKGKDALLNQGGLKNEHRPLGYPAGRELSC